MIRSGMKALVLLVKGHNDDLTTSMMLSSGKTPDFLHQYFKMEPSSLLQWMELWVTAQLSGTYMLFGERAVLSAFVIIFLYLFNKFSR